MVSIKKTRFRAGSVLALIAGSLALAACGGSSSSSQHAKHASAASQSTSVSNVSATGAKVSTKKGPMGTYLVGPSGRALYLWLADSKGKSNCSGACAQAWPPLVSTASPSAVGGASQAAVSTIKRSDGRKQVAYNGHPLYYYVGDTAPGMTTGQGSNNFGAKWWLVAPSGATITRASSSSSSSGGSSSSSSGGGWG